MRFIVFFSLGVNKKAVLFLGAGIPDIAEDR